MTPTQEREEWLKDLKEHKAFAITYKNKSLEFKKGLLSKLHARVDALIMRNAPFDRDLYIERIAILEHMIERTEK